MECPVIYDTNTKIWSNPMKVLQTKMCLGERILKQLDEKDPNKIIEINYDNGKSLIASELKNLIISAAQNLLNLGIKKGDIVLFFNGFNSLTAPIVFACYLIGVAICPIELSLTDDVTDYIIEKLNPTIILYDPVYKSRVESIIKRITVLNLKYILSFEPSNDGKSVPEMLCQPVNSVDAFEVPVLGNPDSIVAAILLTSGTTGKPKLSCLAQSQISAYACASSLASSGNIIYVPTAFRWIVPVLSMLMPIFGEYIRVFSAQKPTAELCLDVIRKYEVTHIIAVDGLVRQIFQYAEKEKHIDYLKSMRCLSCGGERISKVTYELVRNLTPECTFIKCYGMTEFPYGIALIVYDFTSNDIDFNCGYINTGCSIKILDDNKNALGPNQNGQICLKGMSPHLKYYKDDKVNAESYSSDNEWFLNGDYGKIDDNHFVHVYNRCNDLIRCGKNVVIPAILEQVLESHIAVEASYIVGIPDSSKGEIPVAFVKLNTHVENSEKSQEDIKDDINNFIKSKLPFDQLPPEKIFIVEHFPNTSCGKIDKMKLKEIGKECSTG